MGTVVPPPPNVQPLQAPDGVMRAAPGTAAAAGGGGGAAAGGYGMYPYNAGGGGGGAAVGAGAAAGMVYQPTRVAGAGGGGGSLVAKGNALLARLPQHDGPDSGEGAAKSDDEESLGDDDDDSEEEDDTDNFIICQCDRNKIKRKTDRYRVVVRDGIMKLNDTEYMFSKLEGAFTWLG